ncbi:MAG TPA: glycoside hydrolase family 6 protein [Solirubrobacteraceae bacterium]|nr:glycoside hydrolase family 6 protein [Solirubrobacteraceae bacterium]
MLRLLASLRRIALALPALAVSLMVCAPAHAAPYDPNGFRFESSSLSVHENAGEAVITVQRADARQEAQVRYITIGITAVAPYDYTPVKAMIDFAAGQSTATFSVPIVDHGVNGLPKTIQLSLFGPATYPGKIGLADPSKAVLTILNDDPPLARIAGNPLGLPSTPTGDNPLAGASFFVDHQSEAANDAGRYPALNAIASQPDVEHFGTFSGPDIGIAVAHYLDRAAVQEPGTVPMLATYRLVYGHCGHWSDPVSEQQAYHDFMSRFAAGVGGHRAVLFLEMDSLITVGCLNQHGLAVRMHELDDAINVLTANCPHLVVYLDAGAADAVPAPQIAKLLRRAGVAKIQGFFLNSTHFDWTTNEIRYGEQISRLTGGRHFVVNTAENGRGPLVPHNRVKNGNEVLCNPLNRGLGPVPTAATGFRNVDAFAWIANPGKSGGQCRAGAPKTGNFWLGLALELVRNANFRVS